MSREKSPVEEQATPIAKPRAKPQEARQKLIPKSEHRRVRVLVEYGMTVEQVAELYRVPIQFIRELMRPERTAETR
jgi:hypothetical protein